MSLLFCYMLNIESKYIDSFSNWLVGRCCFCLFNKIFSVCQNRKKKKEKSYGLKHFNFFFFFFHLLPGGRFDPGKDP